MERRRVSTSAGVRSRGNTLLSQGVDGLGGNHRKTSNFGEFRYDYEAAQQQLQQIEGVAEGKRGSAAAIPGAHANVSQALKLMRDINWNTRGAQVVHSSAEEYTAIQVSSVEEIKRSVKCGASSRAADKASRDYMVPEVDLAPKYVRPMTASAALLEEVLEIEHRRRALETRKASSLRKSSSLGAVVHESAVMGEAQDQFNDSFAFKRSSVTASAPRTQGLLSGRRCVADIGSFNAPRPHTSLGTAEGLGAGGSDLLEGAFDRDATALMNSLSLSSPHEFRASRGARGRIVLPSMASPPASASEKARLRRDTADASATFGQESLTHGGISSHPSEDSGNASRRSSRLHGGTGAVVSTNSSVDTASSGSVKNSRRSTVGTMKSNSSSKAGGNQRNRAPSNISGHLKHHVAASVTQPQLAPQSEQLDGVPGATVPPSLGEKSLGAADGNQGAPPVQVGSVNSASASAEGAVSHATAALAQAHTSDASRSMDAMRRIDEKAARIHARQLQIETRAQQAAWLRVVAVLTRASILVNVVLRGRNADTSQRALKAGQRIASKMARWLNLARLRILQRRAPELFKVLRSALLRYRVRVFVSKTRAHTALIKLFLRDSEAVNARVMKMKSFRFHIMKIQKYIRGYLDIQRHRQQLLRLALDRMVCSRLLQYKRDKAKHEVDSIASLRAVREWSASVGRLERTGAGIQGMLQHTFNLVAKRRRFMQDACIHGLAEAEYRVGSSSPAESRPRSGVGYAAESSPAAGHSTPGKGSRVTLQAKAGDSGSSSDGSDTDDDSVDGNSPRGQGGAVRRAKDHSGGGSRVGASRQSQRSRLSSRSGHGGGGEASSNRPPLVNATTVGYPGASVFFQGSVRSFRPRYTHKMITRDLIVIVTNQRKRHCLAVAEAEVKTKKTRNVDDAVVSKRARAFLLTAGDLGPVEDVEALNRRRKFNHRSVPFLLLTAGGLLELEHVAAAVLRCYIEAEEAHEKKVQSIMRSARERQEMEHTQQLEPMGPVVQHESWPEPQRGYNGGGLSPVEAILARPSGNAGGGGSRAPGTPTPSASPFISPR